MINSIVNISDYFYRKKNFLFLLFLLPPLSWLGIIYLGSLLTFLSHSFFSLDGFTGKINYTFTFNNSKFLTLGLILIFLLEL